MKISDGLSFDDVLLVTKYSDISSRNTKEIDVSIDLGKNVKLNLPISSSNMKSVTGWEMASFLAKAGGLPILHRFYENPLKDIPEAFRLSNHPNVGCSVGVQSEDFKLVDAIVEAGCRIICVDVAHGDHKKCHDMVFHIAKNYPKVLLIAGNVATADGCRRLQTFGADVVKVGIGPGSLCTTRVQTGNGVPQLTALMNCFALPNRPKIIADGGIKNSGDCVKALCFSDMVMIGSLLAGTDEAPGMLIRGTNGEMYKEYAGSSTHKTSHIEGVKTLTPTKGPAQLVLDSLLDGILSGFSYQGARNLLQLQADPEFVRITAAGLRESHPHHPMVK